MRLLILIPFLCLVAQAEPTPPPEATLKYHTALLKNPHNPTLYSRFHETWLDDQPLDSLTEFLKSRAKDGSENDLAILAHHLLHRGLEDEAIAALNNAITALPNDPALLLARAKILTRRLDFDLAHKDLDAVAASNNELLAIEAAKLIGKSHLREGNPDAAVAAWEKLIAKHPENQEILEDLIELTATSDQPKQAIEYSNRLIKTSTDPFKKAQYQIRLGELLADSGQSEDAIKTWTETLSQTGEGSWLEREIIARITTSYRRQDRIDSLSAKLTELATANPRRLLIHRELAKLEATEGNLDSAIGRFREVLRRSPGDAELREEFIRLLIDGQRFEDATAELQKMISASPENPDLHLRMADLEYRRAENDPNRAPDSPTPPVVLAALEKALTLLPPGEASGIRIAGLMLNYGLNENGEKNLTKLAAEPNATSAPSEALAAEYARTERKKQAIEILTNVAKSTDVDTVLRATSTIASLGESDASFTILSARLTDFPNQPSYLTALVQTSLAAKKATDAITPALRLVRLATLHQEILDTTRLATSVITISENTDAEIASLTARNDRTPSETCLLAALLETKADSAAVDALFKNATEPNLLRFHSSILSQRGDFTAAIDSLKLFSEKAGAKPDFLKELAELQLRAGQITECLATLDEWKTAAPTAREPWIIASRLHQQSGKIADAIETTSRALTRFPDDEDLTASLADLYMTSGDNAEAERIFWKLYDKAQDSAAQSRWASRLSMLAQRYGTTAELAENFLTRARSNSRSTGPVLALVELARSTGDRNAVRDHLARALFIKPGDVDIRIQLAQAEADSGNPENQISILSEGTDKDPAGRLRTALAQAHISNGEVIKGLRILRALAGERASDPRAVEGVVTSLHSRGKVTEAIQYLREALPDGSDWRTKFLLAIMLQEDGREMEAIPVFLSLLSEEAEIQTLIPAQNANNLIYGHYIDPTFLGGQNTQNPKLTELVLLTSVAQTANRISNRRYEPISQSLPIAVANLRASSLIRLATIASSGNTEAAEAITAARPKGLAFAIDLVAALKPGNNPDYISLLEKYPEQPGLIDMVWQHGGFHQTIEKRIPLLKRILANAEASSDIRFYILTTLIRLEPEETKHWEQLLLSAENAINSDNSASARSVAQQLFNLVASEKPKPSPEQIDKIKELLLKYATGFPEHPDYNMRLNILAYAGTREQWIAALNSAIATHRALPKPKIDKQNLHYLHSPWGSRGGRHVWDYQGMNYAALPNLSYLPFSSIPPTLCYLILTDEKNVPQYQNFMTAKELLQRLDEIESPLFRAFITVKSGNEKAITKALSVPHPEIEAYDFLILRAAYELSKERPVEACRIYAKLLDSSSSNPGIDYSTSTTLIFIATGLTPEQRKEFEQPLRTALKKITPPPSPYRDLSDIIEKANLFGFTDITKSLTPAPAGRNPGSPGSAPARIGLPATITPPSSRHHQTRTNPIDRFRTFAREEKNTAAAREFLRWVNDMTSSGNSMEYIAREASNSMTPAIKAEILSISDPGSSNSITKYREFIDICLALDEQKKALETLSKLAEERPFDHSITCQLAFQLPPSENERAISLLKDAAGSPYLFMAINSAQNNIRNERDKAQSLAFIERITGYLESTTPDADTPDSLNQISSIARNVFSSGFLKESPSLIKTDQPDEKKPHDAEQVAIARRLTIAMMRHKALAKTGFSLLNSAVWDEKPIDLEAWARSCLLLSTSRGVNGHYYYSSSNPYPDKSPTHYLLSRLVIAPIPTPPDLLPSAFLEELGKNDPHLPILLRFHSTPATTKSIAALWDTGAMEASQFNETRILQQAAFKRVAATPGASKFFLTLIKNIRKEQKDNSSLVYNQSHHQLFRAAFETCASLDEKGVNEICSAIIDVLYAKDQKNQNQSTEQQFINVLQVILNNFSTDFKTASRIIHSFDSSNTPLHAEWLQSNMMSMNKIKPAEAVEVFASMGLLADANSWKPLALTTIEYDYSGIKTNVQTIRTRTDQFAIMVRNLPSTTRQEIAKLLEARKPQTFGSLITAASLHTDSNRQRLSSEAFKLAAPTLAKASPRRLEDFSLLIHLLPHSATTSLPKNLREIALKNRAEETQKIVDIARQSIDQARLHSQNPLGNIYSQIVQLAALDLDKSVEIFLEATEIFFLQGNISTNQDHNDSLDSILRSIALNENPDPETALRFYQAVMKSPLGSRFAISATSNNHTFLTSIGRSIGDKSDASKNWNRDKPQEAWLAASKMPEDLRSDAFAALACELLRSGNTLNHEQALQILTDITDPDIRAYALPITTIASWQYDKAEAKVATSAAFVSLLAHPDLTAAARTQIALTAASAYRNILTDPTIAEAIANVFEAHCEREISMVSNIPLEIVSSIGNENPPPAAITHLKRINDAFWKNANSPIESGHPPISEYHTHPLFLTAMKVGDDKTAKRLFPMLQQSLSGNSSFIVSMVSTGNFDFATALLPDDNTFFQLDSPQINYTPEFQEKLTAFGKSGINPTQFFRLECALLRMRTPEGNNPTQEFTAERRKRLIASYIAAPPTSNIAKLEILAVLATNPKPSESPLAQELAALAATLNPEKVLIDWNNGSSDDHIVRSAAIQWVILCKAAMNELITGKSSTAVKICTAITKHSAKLKPSDYNNNLRTSHRYLLSYSLPATFHAVAIKQTDGFKGLIQPLADLATTLSSSDNYEAAEIRACLALCEFYAAWHNQPEVFPNTLAKIKNNREQLTEFDFPRAIIPLLKAFYTYGAYQNSSNTPLFSNKEFIKELLSHPPIAYLLPSGQFTLLDEAVRGDANEDIIALAKGPQESFSPGGRAVLAFYHGYYLRNRNADESTAAFRTALSLIPDEKPWNHLRGSAKCYIVARLSLIPDKIPEARTIYDSIKPEEIHPSQERFYKSVPKYFPSEKED